MKLDHQMMTCKIIRANLNILQDHEAEEEMEKEEDKDSHSNSAAASKLGAAYSRRPLSFGRLYLGSGNKAIAFQVLELEHAADPAYHQFRTHFARFLKNTFPSEFAPNWRLNPTEKVCRSNYLSGCLFLTID